MCNYLVIDRNDIKKYLTEEEQLRLSNLNEKMCDGRDSDGRPRALLMQHFIDNLPNNNKSEDKANSRLSFCPDCGRLIYWDSYFHRFFCTNAKCNWRSKWFEDESQLETK